MNRRATRPILLAVGLGLAVAIPAWSQVLLSESFDATTFGPSSTMGDTYAGDVSWVIADPTAPSPLEWSVNTSLGWTANDAGGNQYLFASGAGVADPADNTVFRTSGWNPDGVAILSLGFQFAMDPGSQQSNHWGAIILSPTIFADNAAPGADDQSIHIRIQQNGGTGTLGTSAAENGPGPADVPCAPAGPQFGFRLPEIPGRGMREAAPAAPDAWPPGREPGRRKETVWTREPSSRSRPRRCGTPWGTGGPSTP